MNSKELKELITLYQQQIKEYKSDVKALYSEYDYKHGAWGKNNRRINALLKKITKLQLRINQLRLKNWFWK